MKSALAALLAALLALSAQGLAVQKLSEVSSPPERPPGYRSAWDDCHGMGASKTERMRALASKIKGWAAPQPPQRNAVFDCTKMADGSAPPKLQNLPSIMAKT